MTNIGYQDWLLYYSPGYRRFCGTGCECQCLRGIEKLRFENQRLVLLLFHVLFFGRRCRGSHGGVCECVCVRVCVCVLDQSLSGPVGG